MGQSDVRNGYGKGVLVVAAGGESTCIVGIRGMMGRPDREEGGSGDRRD